MPVSYASQAVTVVDKLYAQFEKKTLDQVYGYKRFHDFLYGCSFKVEIDHKTLIETDKKGLGEAPPRIQKLLLKV